MNCPASDAGKLEHGPRNVPYNYKGEITSIPGVTWDFCPACVGVILGEEDGQRFGAMVREFNKQVSPAFVEQQFILRVRNKLNLEQREAVGIFGGGINAFRNMKMGGPNLRCR